jgi:hypothetical protein
MKCFGIATVTEGSGKKSEAPVGNFTSPALLNATEPTRMLQGNLGGEADRLVLASLGRSKATTI